MLSALSVRLSLDAMTVGTLLIVALVLRAFPPLWERVVGGIDRHRVHSLDGARGVLTTWVLSHHLFMASSTDQRGVWHPPAGALGALMASNFFVAPFFMLTAMLFAGRLMANGGKLNATSFFITRSFRLIPAYAAAVSLLFVGALITSGFHLHVTAYHLAKELARWMMFDFVKRYDINGVDMVSGYGVLWTLRYEVIFYALLPVIALGQRWLRFRLLPIVALFLLGYFLWPFLFFGAGALASFGIRKISGARSRLVCQCAAALGLAIIITAAMYGVVYHLLQAICLVPMFVCLAIEAPLVRFLSWRPLRLIGEISYSNYVLHGAVLYILGATIFSMPAIIHLPLVPRVASLTLIGSFALGCALVCFMFIEQPFIRLGAALAKRLEGGRRRSDYRQAISPPQAVSIN